MAASNLASPSQFSNATNSTLSTTALNAKNEEDRQKLFTKEASLKSILSFFALPALDTDIFHPDTAKLKDILDSYKYTFFGPILEGIRINLHNALSDQHAYNDALEGLLKEASEPYAMGGLEDADLRLIYDRLMEHLEYTSEISVRIKLVDFVRETLERWENTAEEEDEETDISETDLAKPPENLVRVVKEQLERLREHNLKLTGKQRKSWRALLAKRGIHVECPNDEPQDVSMDEREASIMAPTSTVISTPIPSTQRDLDEQSVTSDGEVPGVSSDVIDVD